MKPEVAIVTVNWNGWRHTLDCLAALRRSRGVSWRLIIVDNASTDGSIDKLTGLGDDVILIRSPRNGGWTGGNNLGVEHALREGYEHILVLNNDAFVETDALAAFMDAQSRPAAAGAILGGVLRTGDGAHESQAIIQRHPKTGLTHGVAMSEAGPASADGLLQTDFVCGAALFAHRSLYESVGLFDDDFYLYYDESDWCARAAKRGRRSWIVERAVVRHVGLASIGGQASPIFNYFMTRNSLLFTERHATTKQRVQWARILFGGLRKDARALKEGVWPIALLNTSDHGLRARRRGALDYLTRRFGDCPSSIRRLQEDWRLSIAAAS